MAARKSAARKSNQKAPGNNAAGKFCIVLTTVDKPQLAHKIAETLVKDKIAACVNIVPNIKSVYRWKGKIESVEEFLLIIKTTQVKIKSLEAAIKKLHTYSVPEFIVLEIKDGSSDYMGWILESTIKNRKLSELL